MPKRRTSPLPPPQRIAVQHAIDAAVARVPAGAVGPAGPAGPATTDASLLTAGLLPLARVLDLTNAQIAAAAAIDWTKISKAGSSLADLITRSAADLSSGILPAARFIVSDVWTPAIGGDGGQSGQVYSGQTGFYLKIGPLVFVAFRVALSTLGTITGNVQIQGLPFASLATALYRTNVAMSWGNTTTAYVFLQGSIVNNATVITLNGVVTPVTSLTGLAQADLSNTTVLAGSVVYYAA